MACKTSLFCGLGLKLPFCILTFFLVTHCGDSEGPSFSPRPLSPTEEGPNSEGNPGQETPAGEEGSESELNLVDAKWAFSCPDEAVTADSAPVELENGGEHRLKLDANAKLNLAFQGLACLPTDRHRHIVFAISVARSMDARDPENNDTCQRLQTVANSLSALESLPNSAQRVRVGFATFDDRLRDRSDGLVDIATFRSRYLSDNIFCDRNNRQTTSYDMALSPAATMFQSALVTSGLDRGEISREVYLIADQPPRDAADGVGFARRLKEEEEVSINTILVSQTPINAIQNISSFTNDNQPLHASIMTMGGLRDMMEQMTEKVVIDASIELRDLSLDTENWFRLELLDDLYQGFVAADFKEITKSDYPVGLGMRIQLWDSHGKLEGVEGKLLFD